MSEIDRPRCVTTPSRVRREPWRTIVFSAAAALLDPRTGGFPKTSRGPARPAPRISESTFTASGAWISSIPAAPSWVTSRVVPGAMEISEGAGRPEVPSVATGRKTRETVARSGPRLVSHTRVVYAVPDGPSGCRTGTYRVPAAAGRLQASAARKHRIGRRCKCRTMGLLEDHFIHEPARPTVEPRRSILEVGLREGASLPRLTGRTRPAGSDISSRRSAARRRCPCRTDPGGRSRSSRRRRCRP